MAKAQSVADASSWDSGRWATSKLTLRIRINARVFERRISSGPKLETSKTGSKGLSDGLINTQFMLTFPVIASIPQVGGFGKEIFRGGQQVTLSGAASCRIRISEYS